MNFFERSMRWLCLGVVILVTPLIAHSTTVFNLDFSTLMKLSEQVVLARVTHVSYEGRQTPRQIQTVIQLEVKECLVGPCDATVELRQLGGQFKFDDGIYTQSVSGTPVFTIGERVLVFLERTDTGRLVVTGLSQGKFTVLSDASNAPIIRRLDGLNMLEPKGRFRAEPHQRVTIPTRIDVLRALIAKMVPIVDIRPTRAPQIGGRQ